VALLSAGCVPVAIEAAKKAWEDRSNEDQVTDAKIYGGILSRLSDKDKKLLLDVSADVWEGRVLLTGTLDSRKTHREVLSLVRRDKRIRKFYDEVRIVTKAEKEEGGAVNDFWIELKINARLLTTKGVTSVNFRWRSGQVQGFHYRPRPKRMGAGHRPVRHP
jgi:hyperosmotically inducible protein